MSLASVQLLRAAASGDLDRLRTLLVQGVDVNTTNKANQTALMLAAGFKRVEIVEYLVLAGADVNAKDELGLSAEDWARQDVRITRLLSTPAVTAVHQPSEPSATPSGLVGAIQRDHTSINAGFATAVARETPTIAESVSAASISSSEQNEEAVNRRQPASPTYTNAPAAPVGVVASRSDTEPPESDSEEEPPLPHVQPMSPALRTWIRVSIVVLLIVGAFGAYHVVTSVFTNRTSNSVKPEPASAVNAATKPAKAAPVVGGALAGTELFVPDAPYPADATVANGDVTVALQVSRKGIVIKAEAIDGDESLHSTAEKAALSSAFAPEKLAEKGEIIAGIITYNFLKPEERKLEFGLSADGTTGINVSATVGGPLAGAERKLVIPKIPKWVTVQQQSATLVVRVNKSGRVMSFRPLDAEGLVRTYLTRAARASTFDPTKLNTEGQVVGTITYKFQ